MQTSSNALLALMSDLERRGFVCNGRSKWGISMPVCIQAGHEPQRLMDATALQRRFIACAHATPSPGTELCASWVEQSFSRLGLGVVLGSAAELCRGYCHYSDTADLKVGMIVATEAHPYTAGGLRNGHVGVYAGNDEVLDCADNRIRRVPLELWLTAYGIMSAPRWGWLGTIGLS